MALAAKQSTARTFIVGPVLDADGVAVTGCVIGDFKLSKNGGAPAAFNGSATLTHRHTGFYSLAATATDFDTVGTFQVTIDDTTNSCAMVEFQVISADNYVLYESSGVLPANVTQVNSSGDAAVGLSAAGLHYDSYDHFDTDQNLLSSAITTVNSQTEFVLTSGSTVNDAYNGKMIIINGALSERWVARVVDYVGATKTITIDAAAYWTVDTADSINIIAVPAQVTALPTATAGAAGGVFIAGSNAATTVDFTGTITTVTNLTNLPTIPANWLTAAGTAADFGTEIGTAVWATTTRLLTAGTNIDGSTFTAIPWNASWDAEVQSEVADALGVFWTSPATLVDLVWDEPTSGHATAGTTGKALTDAGSAGDPWATSLPGAYTSDQAGKVLADILVDTGTTLQGELDGIQADTEDIQTRLPAALVSGRMDASVGAMAANTLTASALATDAVTEIQSGLALEATSQSILTDTGTTLPATLTTIEGKIDTADTAIDAVATTIGVAGAGLTEAGGTGDQLTALATQASVDDLPTNAELATAIITGLTTALTEGYRGTGATGSVRDMLYEMLAHLGNMGIAGTTKTLTKLDKATTAKTFTLDDATTPTAIEETT